MPQPYRRFSWPTEPVAAPPADVTIDPAIAAKLLILCAEMLAATFVILELSIADMTGARALLHLRRAQDEVTQAQAWLLDKDA